MADYCSITTDLEEVFPGLEKYQLRERVESWTSEASNVYSKAFTGNVAAVFVDGAQYTLDTDTSPDAGKYYYSADVDILYIHITADGNPSANTIYIGEDWDGLLTKSRDRAQQMVDARLNNKYETPLVPRSQQIHNTAVYEYDIVRVTALLTCWLVVSRRDADCKDAKMLYKQVWNPDPGEGESKGLLNLLMDGEIVLQDQISVRETGEKNFNVNPYSSNTVDFQPIFFGPYSGNKPMVWRIQIDTGGALGTATYKVSYDQGSNWDLTLQKTKDDDNNQIRFSIASGIYVRFPETTWVVNEYWDLELIPQGDTATNAKISSIPVVR